MLEKKNLQRMWRLAYKTKVKNSTCDGIYYSWGVQKKKRNWGKSGNKSLSLSLVLDSCLALVATKKKKLKVGFISLNVNWTWARGEMVQVSLFERETPLPSPPPLKKKEKKFAREFIIMTLYFICGERFILRAVLGQNEEEHTHRARIKSELLLLSLLLYFHATIYKQWTPKKWYIIHNVTSALTIVSTTQNSRIFDLMFFFSFFIKNNIWKLNKTCFLSIVC